MNFDLLFRKKRFYTGAVGGEMDISDQRPNQGMGTQAESANGSKGEELLETVISLTGLPEALVSEELEEILAKSGHSSGSLTLDQLRESLLLYLEQIQEETVASGN